jgi:hypothetical protein
MLAGAADARAACLIWRCGTQDALQPLRSLLACCLAVLALQWSWRDGTLTRACRAATCRPTSWSRLPGTTLGGTSRGVTPFWDCPWCVISAQLSVLIDISDLQGGQCCTTVVSCVQLPHTASLQCAGVNLLCACLPACLDVACRCGQTTSNTFCGARWSSSQT